MPPSARAIAAPPPLPGGAPAPAAIDINQNVDHVTLAEAQRHLKITESLASGRAGPAVELALRRAREYYAEVLAEVGGVPNVQVLQAVQALQGMVQGIAQDVGGLQASNAQLLASNAQLLASNAQLLQRMKILDAKVENQDRRRKNREVRDPQLPIHALLAEGQPAQALQVGQASLSFPETKSDADNLTRPTLITLAVDYGHAFGWQLGFPILAVNQGGPSGTAMRRAFKEWAGLY